MADHPRPRRPRPWRLLGLPGRRELPLGFRAVVGVGALVCLVIVCIGVTAALGLSVRNHETRLDDQAVPFSSAVARASLSAKSAANDQRGFLLTGDTTYVVELREQVAAARHALDEAADAAVGPDQVDAIAQASAGFDQWTRSLHHELAIYRDGFHSTAVHDAMGANREIRKGYERSLGVAQRLADDAVDEDASAFDSSSSLDLRLALGVLAVALIASCAVAWWLVRSIIVPLHSLVTILVPRTR